LPQGGETVVSFPNSHLGYAITWFGLAAALAGVYAVFVWRRLRGKSA
jgi:surfeit locus 1 family protein